MRLQHGPHSSDRYAFDKQVTLQPTYGGSLTKYSFFVGGDERGYDVVVSFTEEDLIKALRNMWIQQGNKT